MDEGLISKRALLELTGISYGSLYRWKRKNLIPEDWFVRKSTFTGQETFFPKDKILRRIEKIKDMKEELSLDDLAGMFSPNPADVSLLKDDLVERNIVTKLSLGVFLELYGSEDVFTFERTLFAYVFDKELQSGEINLDEGKMLLQTLFDNYKNFEGKNCEIVCTRKCGIFSCFLVPSPIEIYFEKGTKVVKRLNIASCVEELKIKIARIV